MNLAEAKRLIIFGGRFDPPHCAHVALPEEARQRIDADAVVYIPVGIAPHRPDAPLTETAHRLAMLKLALQDSEHAIINTLEIDRAKKGEPTYTVDTLEILTTQWPGVELRLLIGTDQMQLLHTWRNPDRVIELAKPLVLARGEALSTDDTQTHIDISATELRRKVSGGQSIERWVHPNVVKYIEQHGLYGKIPRN